MYNMCICNIYCYVIPEESESFVCVKIICLKLQKICMKYLLQLYILLHYTVSQ